MRSSGIEDLKTVLRRSAVLIVAVVVIGVVAMNLIRQVNGPSYNASARVVLNTSDLSSAALGISPPYQDPARVDQAEQNLVDSPDLYAYAARRAGGGPTASADINEKPWDAFNTENAPLHPEAMKTMWNEFRGLAMAAQELTRNGSQAQQERAGQLLAETKRKLYGLLADGDMHNGDDLR